MSRENVFVGHLPLTVDGSSKSNFFYRNLNLGKWQVPVIVILWFALVLVATTVQLFWHSVNDYLIYRGEFWHTVHQTNLYTDYPGEYWDSNHYGPVFSLVIAPFALMSVNAGVTLWGIVNAAILLYVIRQLPFSNKNQLAILAICAIELMTCMHNMHVNPMIAAWIILAYVLVEKEQDFWATLFIALGFLVKLYGIGALIFFVFSKRRFTFAWSFIFWCIVLFCLPMLISSPRFIVQSYFDWYNSLVVKDVKNSNILANGGMQDISVMGMIRNLFGIHDLNNLVVLLPALVLIILPLFRVKQWASDAYRVSYLALTLISVVIFSTASGSPTYIIPMVGVAIWFVLYKQPGNWIMAALLFALLLTSLSPTDLFPHYINKHYIRPYSLKALPCVIVWLWLIVNLSLKNFLTSKTLAVA